MEQQPIHGTKLERAANGRFLPGHTLAAWSTGSSGAARIRQCLQDLATPDLIQAKFLELLSDPSGHVKGQALSLLLAYTLGKPKESIEITGTQQALPSLSPEALALVIRDMQRGEAPVIDATFNVQSDNQSDKLSDGD